MDIISFTSLILLIFLPFNSTGTALSISSCLLVGVKLQPRPGYSFYKVNSNCVKIRIQKHL